MMRHRVLLLSIYVLICSTTFLPGVAPKTDRANPLESFYVVTHFFSDDLPSGYEEILQVKPEGKDVCVRVIRISVANRDCGGQLVRAAERTLPDRTVEQVTGKVDLCSYSDREVEGALKRAAPKNIEAIFDSATQDIVARCGGKEIALSFPHPEQVDLKALQQNDPRVRELWDLSHEVRTQTFGGRFSFQSLPAEKEKELEALGTKLLPELVSGTFETGFSGYTCGNQKCEGNYHAWRLKGYVGPPVIHKPTVELVNAESLHLQHYDLPPYPPLARQTRLFGEARLKIFTDQRTGVVNKVEAVSGPQLLVDLSATAAKKWQFSPETSAVEPVEAILKFTLCPGEN
jgi:hypothetical protein